tara:strand:- start:77 stop:904 length:828 start_codon:yes stop_codon:yes gene_type:complete
MGWFDILKISGKELLNAVEFSDIHFRDRQTPKSDHGYSVKNTTMTRPHFEGKSESIGALDKDDLQLVRRQIGAKGELDERILNFSFAAPDNEDYIVTWRRVPLDRELPGSGLFPTPTGEARPKPTGFSHKDAPNGIVIFDSVYPTDVNTWDDPIGNIEAKMADNNVTDVLSLWPNDSERWTKVKGQEEDEPEVTWTARDEKDLESHKRKQEKYIERKRKLGNKYKGDGRFEFRKTEIARLEKKKKKAEGGDKKQIDNKRKRRGGGGPPNIFGGKT